MKAINPLPKKSAKSSYLLMIFATLFWAGNFIAGKYGLRGMSPGEGLTFQVQNGQRVIVWPERLAEAEYVLPMPRWEERPSK